MLPSDRQGPRRRVAFQGSRLHPDASASQGLPNRGLGRYKTLPGSGPAWRAATARFRAGNSGPARPSAPSSARCPIFRRWLESTGTVPTDRRAASRLPLPSGPRRSQVRVPSRPDGPGGWVKSGSALVGRLTAGDAAQNRRADLHTTRRPDRPNSSRSALQRDMPPPRSDDIEPSKRYVDHRCPACQGARAIRERPPGDAARWGGDLNRKEAPQD
jgi:hypothetical protein